MSDDIADRISFLEGIQEYVDESLLLASTKGEWLLAKTAFERGAENLEECLYEAASRGHDDIMDLILDEHDDQRHRDAAIKGACEADNTTVLNHLWNHHGWRCDCACGQPNISCHVSPARQKTLNDSKK